MIKFLAVASGFCVTLLIFAGGVFTTLAFVTAEPTQDQAPKMHAAAMAPVDKVVKIAKGTAESEGTASGSSQARADAAPQPVPNDAAAQPAPATQLASESGEMPMPADDSESGVDPVTTAALNPEDTMQQPAEAPGAQLGAQHVAWCSQHYRSYDPTDNHYNAYSGERRQCVSPFSEGAGPAVESASIVQASDETSSGFVGAAEAGEMPAAAMNSQHIQDCFARYQSYRAEDNSYQPYGGGPRQQCE